MEKDASGNPRCVGESDVSYQGEEVALNVRVGEVVRDQFALRKTFQQAERRIQSHRKSRKSGRRGKSPDDDDEVIFAESTRSLRGKEVIVQNIQTVVEQQCRRSRRSRRLRYTSCSSHVKWRMCSRVAMTSACNSEWRTPVRGFHTDPVHRKERYCPLLRGQVLMSQLRKNIVEFPMVQKIDSPSTKQPDSPEVFEGPTQTSTIPDCVADDHEISIAIVAEELMANNEGFPICGDGEGAEYLQCHRTSKRPSSSNTLIMNRLTRSDRQRCEPNLKRILRSRTQSPRSDEQCVKRVLQKSSRVVRRVSWSTKLSLRFSFTLKRKGCRDHEPGSNGEEFT